MLINSIITHPSFTPSFPYDDMYKYIVIEINGQIESEKDRFPGEISGGQQQRVAIARSIAKKPTLLLGDELTGNLDTETSSKVMQVLVEACEKENITAVLVTHDESLIKYGTRVIRIDSGKIQSDEKVLPWSE